MRLKFLMVGLTAAVLTACGGSESDEGNEGFQRVVGECALKLRDDEAPKSAPPVYSGGIAHAAHITGPTTGTQCRSYRVLLHRISPNVPDEPLRRIDTSSKSPTKPT